MRLVWRALALSGLMLSVSAAVQAQIKIGQTAAFSGPGAAVVQETTEGARLYIDAVNAQGGIRGQQIELISMDDKYEPRLSAANTKALIEQGVLAMFLSRGTAQSQAMLPLLAGAIPLWFGSRLSSAMMPWGCSAMTPTTSCTAS